MKELLKDLKEIEIILKNEQINFSKKNHENLNEFIRFSRKLFEREIVEINKVSNDFQKAISQINDNYERKQYFDNLKNNIDNLKSLIIKKSNVLNEQNFHQELFLINEEIKILYRLEEEHEKIFHYKHFSKGNVEVNETTISERYEYLKKCRLDLDIFNRVIKDECLNDECFQYLYLISKKIRKTYVSAFFIDFVSQILMTKNIFNIKES